MPFCVARQKKIKIKRWPALVSLDLFITDFMFEPSLYLFLPHRMLSTSGILPVIRWLGSEPRFGWLSSTQLKRRRAILFTCTELWKHEGVFFFHADVYNDDAAEQFHRNIVLQTENTLEVILIKAYKTLCFHVWVICHVPCFCNIFRPLLQAFQIICCIRMWGIKHPYFAQRNTPQYEKWCLFTKK